MLSTHLPVNGPIKVYVYMNASHTLLSYVTWFKLQFWASMSHLKDGDYHSSNITW